MKNTLKKTLALITALSVLSLAGCGASSEATGMDGGLKNTPQATMAGAASENYFAVGDTLYDVEFEATSERGMGIEGDFDGTIDWNTEEYNAIKENSYMSVAANPLSTFSIDVDTASYTNLRRMINEGDYIDTDAIRIEEMINYFSYDYPAPRAGEPFSVTTEISDCPWNDETKLLLVGLQAEEIDLSERTPMNIVFLIDVSGSMNSADKLPLVQKAFTLLTENLTPQDRVSIVTYAGSDRVVLEGADGNNQAEILEAINNLEAGGSTAGADGINTAYRIAEKYFISGGNNRIVLATDGDLNVGISSESELTKLVEKKRESGVYLSVLGFGTGNIKDNKMEALADNGNGNYAYIDSVLEARKVLVEEMGGTLFTVAKDVKLQLEFNPAYVKGYRLIGYENRMLAAEDFEDDTKDAGEIGAGHSVTAIYELVAVDSPMNLSTSDLKYSETSGEENGEMLTVSIRYKEPDGDTSKLLEYPVAESAYSSVMSENLAFASAVAQFGLVLRDSEYKGTATYASIISQLSGFDFSSDSYKAEFLSLVAEMMSRG